MLNRRPLRIGLSARIYHPQAGATGIQSKALQYLEQSVAHWVMSREVMVFMIPSVSGDGIVHRSSIRLSDYPQYLDGLILPHPRAAVRRFVMGPLAEIAPGWEHPLTKQTAAQAADQAAIGRDARPTTGTS